MLRLSLAAAVILPALSSAQTPVDPSTRAPAATSPAPAARLERTYAFARMGAAWALSDEAELLGFDTGAVVEAGAGYRLVPHVAVEAAAGYMRFADHLSELRRAGNDPGDPAVQIDWERELSAIPVAVSVRISGRWRSVEAFGLVGAGAYFSSYESTSRDAAGGTLSLSDGDTALGVHVGAGVCAFVLRRLAVGVEARHLIARPTFRWELPLTTVTSPAQDLTLPLDVFALTGTVAYRF